MNEKDLRYIKCIEDTSRIHDRPKLIYSSELVQDIENFLRELPKDYQLIATLKYGLDGKDPLSYTEIKDKFNNDPSYSYGKSTSSIRNRHKKIGRYLWGGWHSYKIGNRNPQSVYAYRIGEIWKKSFSRELQERMENE